MIVASLILIYLLTKIGLEVSDAFPLGLLPVPLGSFWDLAVDKSSVYGPFQAL